MHRRPPYAIRLDWRGGRPALTLTRPAISPLISEVTRITIRCNVLHSTPGIVWQYDRVNEKHSMALPGSACAESGSAELSRAAGERMTFIGSNREFSSATPGAAATVQEKAVRTQRGLTHKEAAHRLAQFGNARLDCYGETIRQSARLAARWRVCSIDGAR